jgi:signal recognition particle subunit SRP54
LIKDVEISDDPFKGIIAIIYSMTKEEREHPEIINGSRRQRIARGSGSSVQDVNRFLKQFDDTRKMMKAATAMKANPMKMMRAMRHR